MANEESAESVPSACIFASAYSLPASLSGSTSSSTPSAESRACTGRL